MSGSGGPRWVVFDYGEVISHRTRALPDLAAMLGVPDVEEAYFGARDPYDRGCGDVEYWTEVGTRVGVDVDEHLARRLTETDVGGWLHTDAATLRLISELDEHGVRLALLSNAPSTFGRSAEIQPWARAFEHLVFSGDLDTAKPDAEIWRVLLSTIGASPEQCLFFDDRQANVDGALRAGLRAELWRGADHARRTLQRCGALPGPPEHAASVT